LGYNAKLDFWSSPVSTTFALSKVLRFVINILNAFAISSAKCGMGSSKRGHLTNSTKYQKRGVTPEQAIATLKKQGVIIDEKQAEKVLEIMYFLAKLVVNQHFNI
jgi:hypothetical protein